MVKKEYTIIYKFSDVIDTIKAENIIEAEAEADKRLNSGHLELDPTTDTRCYDVEIEEVK